MVFADKSPNINGNGNSNSNCNIISRCKRNYKSIQIFLFVGLFFLMGIVNVYYSTKIIYPPDLLTVEERELSLSTTADNINIITITGYTSTKTKKTKLLLSPKKNKQKRRSNNNDTTSDIKRL
jgi:hypothetical protein